MFLMLGQKVQGKGYPDIDIGVMGRFSQKEVPRFMNIHTL